MVDSLIIVPTYNEVDNIRLLIAAIFQQEIPVHVLFVDDNSQDGTKAEISYVQEKHPGQIFLLERSGKLGLGPAYIAGFKWALARSYQYVIEMDADLSHDPQYLAKMHEVLSKADGALGSRYTQGGGTKNWSWLRRLISRGGSIYARFVLRLKISDLTGGFNGWSRNLLATIPLDEIKSEGYAFQIELKFRAILAGFTLREFPIIFIDRRAGYSKMSGSIIREAIFRLWKLRVLRHKK